MLQAVQAFVCVPVTENVLAAQLATTALAVKVQAVVTRWPGPAVEQVVQAFVCVPVTENVLAAQLAMTALAVKVQADVTRWPGPAVEQVVQAFVCVPAAEYVPAAQLTTTALDAEVQADVTRWPGPAVEQAEHVGFAPATDAKKEPLVHTHAVKPAFGAELALQVVHVPPPVHA